MMPCLLKFVNKELHTPKVIKAALHENPLFLIFTVKNLRYLFKSVEANGINFRICNEEYKDFKMITTA